MRHRRGDRARHATRSGLAQRGLTIIELMVVMAIMIVFVGLGTLAFSNLRSVELDSTTSTLSGALRYVYTLSIHYNKPYRLVIDMDERRFWTEAADSDDPCARYVPEEGYVEPELGAGEEGEGASEAPDGGDQVVVVGKREGDDEAESRPRSRFTRDEDEMLTRKFGAGTNVTGVLTSHHTSVQTEGKAAIYFYPSGFSERAMIWLGEESEDSADGDPTYEPEITLELHSLGRITRHGEVLDENQFGQGAQ